ncbi:salicylate synthase [Micromonospora sp. NPDC023814]|uniref:salicylate synthase n=1 Tax=Micromonospora sp. NPDC023814 TaxID=3154596 RepID=UPI0033D2147B
MTTYTDLTLSDQPDSVVDPLALAVRLARSALFADYLLYERDGCWTFAGGARTTVSLDAQYVHTADAGGERVTRWSGSPGKALQAALAAASRAEEWNAYGWLGFAFSNLLPSVAPQGLATSDGELARMIIPQVEVHISRHGIRSRGVDPAMCDHIRRAFAAIDAPPIGEPGTVDIDVDGARYRASVAQAVSEIRQGWYQKVILSRGVPIPFPVDIDATYELGRRANNPARSFLFHLNGTRVAGFSPEVIAAVDTAGRVVTQPLAGTRACGRGTAADALARRQLEADPKEVFEHAISVRTAQQELRSVCRPESVTVEDFMSVKERGSVQHLGSLVSGKLPDGATAWDALEALFPAVTASGIPKRESLDAIHRLDRTPREIYSGSVLSVSHDGALDATLVLRAIYERNGRSWLRAGAGIVADSTPEREFEETCEKLASIAPFVVPRDTSASA